MQKNIIRKRLLILRKKKYNDNTRINPLIIISIVKNLKKKNIKLGGYVPINYEIDCNEILSKLKNLVHKILLPKIEKNNQMNFYEWNAKDPLTINNYGIPEPISKKKEIPDILLVPIVGFNKSGFRIGYGGGYYDRYIKKIESKKTVLTIGLAYSFQKINSFKLNKYDKKLFKIITEKTKFK